MNVDWQPGLKSQPSHLLALETFAGFLAFLLNGDYIICLESNSKYFLSDVYVPNTVLSAAGP